MGFCQDGKQARQEEESDMTYEVWQDGREIAGPAIVGSLSDCLRWAKMMGGRKAGYRVWWSIP